MGRLLPMSLFVVPFGIAFGIAATGQGLTPIQATLMSGLVFTATAQFAALEFLHEPIAFVSLGLVVLALSARHIIMGAALSPWVNRLPIGRRLLTLAVLSDANFADSQARFQRGEVDVGEVFGGGLMLWSTWVASTAWGAFAGDNIGDAETYGFGAVMLCFFAATVVQMMRGSKSDLILPAAAAAILSVATLQLLPTGWNIILAALVGGLLAGLTNAD